MFSINKYDKIRIGDSYLLEKDISEEMVKIFADLSGDCNPVHMDESYCIEHGLDSRIVHGMLILSFLSTFIGMYLPGEGSVWLSQTMDFITPVRIGDSIKISGRVIDKNDNNALSLNIVTLKIEICNQSGKKVARGTVKVSVS